MTKLLAILVLVLVGFTLLYQPRELASDFDSLSESQQVINEDSLKEARNIGRIKASVKARRDSLLLDTLLDLQTTITKIAEYNQVDSKHVGVAGSITGQWIRFVHLKKIAPTSELIKLTNHKNATVRCYAFQALVDRNYSKVNDILLRHANDTALVKTMNGCIGFTMPTRNYFIRALNLSPEQEDIAIKYFSRNKNN